MFLINNMYYKYKNINLQTFTIYKRNNLCYSNIQPVRHNKPTFDFMLIKFQMFV